jgi:peptide chain release factor 3
MTPHGSAVSRPTPLPITSITEQDRRRRTFAVISCPDVGNTTLTQEPLLFGSAIRQAGSITSRNVRKHAKSDRMAL